METAEQKRFWFKDKDAIDSLDSVDRSNVFHTYDGRSYDLSKIEPYERTELDYKFLRDVFDLLDDPLERDSMQHMCDLGHVPVYPSFTFQGRALMEDDEYVKWCPSFEMEATKVYITKMAVNAGWCAPITQQEIDMNLPRVYLPQFAIPKQDGTARLVNDARDANQFFYMGTYDTDLPTSPLVYPWKWGVKIDLTNSYMHLSLAEDTSWYQCFYAGGKPYRWIRLVWGSNVSPKSMQQTMSNIAKAVEKMTGYKAKILVYLDDFMIISQQKEDVIFVRNAFCGTLHRAGFLMNLKKSQLTPSMELEWLGFLVNNSTMRVAQQKMIELKVDLERTLSFQFLSNFEAIVGKFSHFAKVVVGARPLTTQLKRAIPGALLYRKRKGIVPIKISKQTQIMLKQAFAMITTEGSVLRIVTSKTTYDVATDATLKTLSISSVLDKEVSFQLPYNKSKIAAKLGWTEDLPIHLLELLAVAHAIYLSPKNINLRVFVDNQSIIAGLPRGGAVSQPYQDCCDYIWRVAQRKRVTLVLTYIKTEDNPADWASRNPGEARLMPQSDPGYKIYDVYNKAVIPVTKEEAVFYWGKVRMQDLVSQQFPVVILKLYKKPEKLALQLARILDEVNEYWILMPTDLHIRAAISYCALRRLDVTGQRADQNQMLILKKRCVASGILAPEVDKIIKEKIPTGYINKTIIEAAQFLPNFGVEIQTKPTTPVKEKRKFLIQVENLPRKVENTFDPPSNIISQEDIISILLPGEVYYNNSHFYTGSENNLIGSQSFWKLRQQDAIWAQSGYQTDAR